MESSDSRTRLDRDRRALVTAVPERDAWLAEALRAMTATEAPAFSPRRLARQVATCAQRSGGQEVGVVLLAHADAEDICVGSGAAAAEVEEAGLSAGEGPAAEARHHAIRSRSVRFEGGAWPVMTRVARGHGFHVVHSFLITDGMQAWGTIDIFATAGDAPPDVPGFTALAGYVAERLSSEAVKRDLHRLVSRLRTALDSRVIVEQAKGMLAQYGGVAPDSAFRALRRYARDRNQRLTDVCAAVVTRRLAPDAIAVDVRTMGLVERRRLRDDAIERYRRALVETRSQLERATSAVARSAELNAMASQIDSESDAVARAIEHRSRRLASTPRSGDRPRVLVGFGSASMRRFAADAIRQDTRLDLVGRTATRAGTLGLSIVEQPDVVVLGSAAAASVLDKITAELRSYCPESRTLLIVDGLDSSPDYDRLGVDRVVARGARENLVDSALQLCGAGAFGA